jgi:DNA-binding GntR family transcriptional regulator
VVKSRKLDCLNDLRLRILTLDLGPGSDLDEVTLADHYGISRTPLREIVQRLAGDGYLELAENRGAKVASMDLNTMRTFFQTAPLIYANIARLAAENRQPAQIEDLKKTQAQFAMATQTAQAAQAAMLNHRFHAIIGEMAHNPYLVASLSRMLIDHTRLSQTFYRPESDKEQALVKKACDQHDAMICAIEAREPALAIDLTLQHWDLSKDRLERFVTPDPLPLDVISLKERRNAV